MNYFDKLNLKTPDIFKMAGIGLVALIVITFILRLLIPSFSSLLPRNHLVQTAPATSPSYAYDMAQTSGKMGIDAYRASEPELSIRNISPIVPPTGGGAGNAAEEFEAKNYYGTIETRDLRSTCAKIVELKAYDYVAFENADQSEYNCHFTFKVQRSHVEEVLARIKKLKPKDLSENIQTIQRTVEDFTSEIEILEKKRDSIQKTLQTALTAYDEITTLATRTQDASSLANVITSKLQIIERLTQESINVNAQLDRLARAKADQLDRVDYTYFSLSVYENKFFDGQQLKDSWKMAVKQFVQDLNRILQDLSINLVTLILLALQYVLYFFIILVIVKYVWRWAKGIWRR